MIKILRVSCKSRFFYSGAELNNSILFSKGVNAIHYKRGIVTARYMGGYSALSQSYFQEGVTSTLKLKGV